MESEKIKCPLGHEQKDRSGYALAGGEMVVRVCDVCGVVFDTRMANKELYKRVQKAKD